MSGPDLDRAAAAIEEFLKAIGAPSNDPELVGTGRRVAEAFVSDLLSGYASDPKAILADTTATRAPGLVLVTRIPTTAMCPHHLLPATGLVHVGYEPTDRVAGLGAIARLVQCHARRLVLQEDLGQRVVDDLVTHLGARTAGCVVDLAPSCMIVRGGRHHGARAISLAFAGDADERFRRELVSLVPRE
jgi:GTP cyclohydrolase IA